MYNPKQTAGTEGRGLSSAERTLWKVINYGFYIHEGKLIEHLSSLHTSKRYTVPNKLWLYRLWCKKLHERGQDRGEWAFLTKGHYEGTFIPPDICMKRNTVYTSAYMTSTHLKRCTVQKRLWLYRFWWEKLQGRGEVQRGGSFSPPKECYEGIFISAHIYRISNTVYIFAYHGSKDVRSHRLWQSWEGSS